MVPREESGKEEKLRAVPEERKKAEQKGCWQYRETFSALKHIGPFKIRVPWFTVPETSKKPGRLKWGGEKKEVTVFLKGKSTD